MTLEESIRRIVESALAEHTTRSEHAVKLLTAFVEEALKTHHCASCDESSEECQDQAPWTT